MSVEKSDPAQPPFVAAPRDEGRRSVPFAWRLIIAAAVYFAVGKLGLKFALLNDSASPIWPATGLALAMLVVWGLRAWPAIFVGAFLVNITTAGSWLNALLIASGNTLEALAGAWLVCSFADGRHAFLRARTIVLFWFLACMAATALAATIGVVSLCVTGAASWSNFMPLWLTWWLGDAVGGFLGAALLLLWFDSPRRVFTGRHALETAAVYTLVAGISILVFKGWFGNRLFFILPALMWAAFRLGPRETAGALALLAFVLIWGTLKGLGPFVMSSHSPNEALLRLQSYLAVNAATTLIVSSVVEEGKKAATGLRLARDEMEERVNERTAMLSSANQRLRVLAASVQGAQEEERQRVARELHDDLGQRMAALKLNMQLLEQELHRDMMPGISRLTTLVGDVDRMIAEVRRISYNLRPVALDDFGLTVALEMLCKEYERVYNFTANLSVDDSAEDLHDEQLDIALYRVAQGALSNVAKHAAATTTTVRMTRNDDSVVLCIEDDGRGFDIASLGKRRDIYSGLGVVGMRERSEMLGGNFTIVSEPGHGTRVEVHIPISNESHRPQDSNSDRG